MKSYQGARKSELLLRKMMLLGLLAISAGFQRTATAANVVLWDAGSRFADTIDTENRAGWKAVPTELFAFEAEPAKAASDPGYYGREYSFKGDAVVENRNLAAVFWSAKGRVVLYSKADATVPNSASTGKAGPGKKILEFVPLQTKTQSGKLSRCEILRNAGDEVVLEVAFSAKGPADSVAVFSFGRNEVVEIKPAETMKGISLL